jgi:hypothetical protein
MPGVSVKMDMIGRCGSTVQSCQYHGMEIKAGDPTGGAVQMAPAYGLRDSRGPHPLDQIKNDRGVLIVES